MFNKSIVIPARKHGFPLHYHKFYGRTLRSQPIIVGFTKDSMFKTLCQSSKKPRVVCYLGCPWIPSPVIRHSSIVFHHKIPKLINSRALVMTNIAIENGPVEIVSCPIKNGDFTQGIFYNTPSGWWFQPVSIPLKNMKVNWDDESPN